MSPPLDLVVLGGTCLTPAGIARIDVGARAGRIVALGDLSGHDALSRLDARGLHVLPGVIDTQVHFREPGLEHKEDLQTGTAAAALGGVTTVFEMPNTKPSTTTPEALADKVRRVAFLGWNEGYGEMWLQAFGASARKAGLEIVATERFAPIDTAITSQALKSIAARPDAVLIVGAGSAAAMPQINLRERGWQGPVYHTHGSGSPDLVRVGGKAMEGAVLPAGPVLVAEQLDAASPVRPVALAYVSRFEALNGKSSRTQFGAHVFDALKVLERIVPVALQRAKPGSEAFRQALRDALESEKEIAVSHGVLNYTKTDHLGFDQRGVVMLRIKNGAFQLEPAAAARP